MRFVGIDPSTKTGFVALDEQGDVIKAKELTGIGSVDPKRMCVLIDEIISHIHTGDVIVIEGFGYSSQQAIQLGGIGWGVRMALHRRGFSYTDVAPNAVKKFVNVSGWVGEVGSKRRLKDKEKKAAVMKAVKEHFNFINKNDNIVDAYIMAQIAQGLWNSKNKPIRFELDYQAEVIDSVLNPKIKTKRNKANIK